MGPEAQFVNEVRYWTESGEMSFDNVAANVQYDPSLGEDFDDNRWAGVAFLGFLFFSLLASLLLSILLIFGFGRYFSRGSPRFQSDFFKNFGFGVLYVLAVPVLIVLLMVTVFGIPLALLLLGLFIFTLIFAPTFAAVLLTYWLRWRNQKEWGNWLMVLISGGIFLVICLLMLIPFIGWLIGIILIGVSFGAILMGASKKRISTVVL